MRKIMLLATASAALTACTTAPPTDLHPPERFVDEQIASSAAAISQSQYRLQQTSAASPPSSPIAPTIAGQVARATTLPVGPVAKPVTVSANNVATPPPITPSPAQSSGAKIIPATQTPPVVKTTITTPPKLPPEPWVVSANDATLRRALTKWVGRAGWQLVWDASVDVPINVDAKFTGDFNTAVKNLFQSLSAADVNLSAVLYSGNRVLRVTESGRRAQ